MHRSGTICSCDAAAALVDGAAAGPRDPVGAPADGIARRTFIVQSALLAAAAALAACGGAAVDTAPTLPSGSSNTINVADYPSLSAVGGVAMVTLGQLQLAIVRTDTSSFVALYRVCPHQGGIVQQSGNGFQCPVHGAQFSLTGQWTGGQRTSNLSSYTTSYDATTDILTIS